MQGHRMSGESGNQAWHQESCLKTKSQKHNSYILAEMGYNFLRLQNMVYTASLNYSSSFFVTFIQGTRPDLGHLIICDKITCIRTAYQCRARELLALLVLAVDGRALTFNKMTHTQQGTVAKQETRMEAHRFKKDIKITNDLFSIKKYIHTYTSVYI